MAEPTIPTFIAAGAVATLLGPVLGPISLIAFGAVAGSLLAMGKASTTTRWEGFKFILVGVVIALAITSSVAWALDHFLSIPGNVALMPVAAIIGAARNSILALMDKVLEVAGNLLAIKGGGK
ncbi:MAG: hypothetical protein Q7U28_08010 [Aquabacterium sp.]|nr:hypothetical protein [Aquabacterium sp.]